MSAEELILELCKLSRKYNKTLKESQKIMGICLELKKLGIVSSNFYSKWFQIL